MIGDLEAFQDCEYKTSMVCHSLTATVLYITKQDYTAICNAETGHKSCAVRAELRKKAEQ